jgi:hypothetical protein
MDITNFLWRFLPDRCSMPHCTRLGVRGNENIVDGRLMCDQCRAIHLLRRSVANEFAATLNHINLLCPPSTVATNDWYRRSFFATSA